MDWFTGKITGKPRYFHGKNQWFPVKSSPQAIHWIQPTISLSILAVFLRYPLVNYTKNDGKIHHFQWVNPLFLWSIFNSYVSHYPWLPPIQTSQKLGDPCDLTGFHNFRPELMLGGNSVVFFTWNTMGFPDFNWLVVWNILYFSIYWECHSPIWLSYFSEG